MLRKRDIDKEQQKKLERVFLVKPPRILWPKSKEVSWETLFDVIYSLDQVGVIHPQLKTNTVDPWDPCWFNGEVQNSQKKIGVTIRHVNKDFWNIWPQMINRKTMIITNPPFSPKWLKPFFVFLATLDLPFLVILPGNISDRLYFGNFLFDRIHRKSELYIFSLHKAFRMKQKGGRITGFSGLTICAYYPKSWKFKLDKTKFLRVITKKCLHIRS